MSADESSDLLLPFFAPPHLEDAGAEPGTRKYRKRMGKALPAWQVPQPVSDLTRQMAVQCAQLLTRPGWHGAYHAGHRKCVAAAKRAEAKRRDERTRPERRRAARARISKE